jgi:hypothetical protein
LQERGILATEGLINHPAGDRSDNRSTACTVAPKSARVMEFVCVSKRILTSTDEVNEHEIRSIGRSMQHGKISVPEATASSGLSPIPTRGGSVSFGKETP